MTKPSQAAQADNKFRTAEYVRILDGDTFLADVVMMDTGTTEHRVRIKVRVSKWNAKELKETEGPIMRDFFAALLSSAKSIIVRHYGMSHDRLVCDVWINGTLFAGMLMMQLQLVRKSNAGNS